MKPYWSDDTVTLYVGDCREILPALDVTADLVLADPPYEETSHAWDRWPDGWLDAIASVASSVWCFGSMRLFGERWQEFVRSGWKYSHDMVWEKQNGAGFTTDRFRRVHEYATHWYQGRWSDIHHQVPRVPTRFRDRGNKRPEVRKAIAAGNTGAIGEATYVDDRTRLTRSVIYAKSLQRVAIHPKEKPLELLTPLISYGCPPGGLTVDPFAGSGSTLDAARQSGRRAVGIEANEEYAEKAARRLSQMTLAS